MSKSDGWPEYLDIVQAAPEEYPESQVRKVGFCVFCGSTEVFNREGTA